MFTRFYKFMLAMAGVSVLLTACGEMDTVLPFPSGGTYRVNALIGKSSLDECSIITEKDTIRPFFTNSVVNDPDITGLMVFLQTPGGKIIGKRVQYTLKAVDTGADADAGNADTGGKDGDEADKKENPGGDVTDTLIHVSDFDKELPLFPLPEDLGIGRYTLVFQFLGEKEVLDRVERPVYYIGGAEFTLDDIQSYPPGISAGSHLVSPGLTIMLESGVTAAEALNPYIVWYNGKKRIYEGTIADGAGRFLWKVPDQTGFQTLRAEVFPFGADAGLKGAVRELSLPVSAKSEHTGAFAKKADQFTGWYLFAGDMRDSAAPKGTNRELLGPKAQWFPAGGIYGLAVGVNDAYQIPLAPFTYAEDEQVEGQFLLRFKPAAEGTVFSALFKGKYPPFTDAVQLDLGLAAGKDSMILVLHTGKDSISIPISTNEAFITVGIDFNIEADHFTAVLNLKNSNLDNSAGNTAAPVSIPLSTTLNGEGVFRLGGSAKPAKNDEKPVTAILDEFAAMYQVIPGP